MVKRDPARNPAQMRRIENFTFVKRRKTFPKKAEKVALGVFSFDARFLASARLGGNSGVDLKKKIVSRKKTAYASSLPQLCFI